MRCRCLLKSFKYLYDFGDGWEHSIKIEKITLAIEGIGYPQLLEASGRCPPEDVGGPWGYSEAREALADPNHERHKEIVEWWGGNILDIDTVDIPGIEAKLFKLSRRWIRKPRTKTWPRSSPDAYYERPFIFLSRHLRCSFFRQKTIVHAMFHLACKNLTFM